VGSLAPSCESASGYWRARSVARCGTDPSSSTIAGSRVGCHAMTVSGLTMTSAVRHPVQRHESMTQMHRSVVVSRNRRGRVRCSYLQLVPSRQDFELEGGARVRRCSQGLENGQERQHHRPEAYLRSAATSTPETRTDFSAGTLSPRWSRRCAIRCSKGRERLAASAGGQPDWVSLDARRSSRIPNRKSPSVFRPAQPQSGGMVSARLSVRNSRLWSCATSWRCCAVRSDAIFRSADRWLLLRPACEDYVRLREQRSPA
jgi:hypothetical protein